MRRAILWFLSLTVLAIAIIEGKAWIDAHPQDLPWTALDLDDPTGRFTSGKIAALGASAKQCRALLRSAGANDRPAPSRHSGGCGFDDGTLLVRGGARAAAFSPAGVVTSCPVAAALLLWDERVVQPAAQRHFAVGVDRILHAGSYSCRRLYGRETGAWSEHATADAIDILGFHFDDGRTISVLRDWRRTGAEAAFLREVHDGACRLFTTVLSPDYNAAHRDHLHLDTAYRGTGGWRACR
jgi:hypothetical protein